MKRNIIYLRVSTLEQDPENQLEECLQFAKSRGYEVTKEDIFIERISGWKKDIKRPYYNQILQLAHEGKIGVVIVWAMDRWIRDRDTLLEDIKYLLDRNIKLHSVKEAYIESVNIDGPLGRTIREFLLGLMGSLAEMESTRKSERVKIAYANSQNKWGRKSLSQTATNKVLKLHSNGLSIRKICEQVQIADKNNNLKNISVGSVHKIISNHKNIEKTQNTQILTS